MGIISINSRILNNFNLHLPYFLGVIDSFWSNMNFDFAKNIQ